MHLPSKALQYRSNLGAVRSYPYMIEKKTMLNIQAAFLMVLCDICLNLGVKSGECLSCPDNASI